VTAFSGKIESNNIFGNVSNAFAGNNCGVINDGVAGLLADKNYWGAATGPGPSRPANDVCNINGGTTITSPFATKPYTIVAPIKP